MSARPAADLQALTAQLSSLPGVRTGRELFAQRPAFPVSEVLGPLFARGGLPQGEIVQFTGPHALSLALASVARATREQHWAAAVGVGEPAVASVADFGVDLERFISLRTPGEDWLRVVSILVETFDIVIARPAFAPSAAQRARLAAKVRERRMTLISLGPFAGAAEQIATEPGQWTGTSAGWGRLRRCAVTATHPRTGAHRLLLPADTGAAEAVVRAV
ncbi:porin [Brevibacterium sp. 5221]|uniref:Porin n=1 Tax=Brevibacterium rongguiense TaxID=2695267 RepID=A0A6N9H549_9MICO|nr:MULTISPECIES: porin [Brevibacterium]MYM18961.1 porin [Brevibacterium rongguiense]WAL40809.1 porin [Brevibacterium sp. BRM-1]